MKMALIAKLSPLIKLSGKNKLLLNYNSLRFGRVVPFNLSDIGEGIKQVTIKEWFVKPGDKVAQFDNICEVQSDKASVTITSRYDGFIKKLHYKIDDLADVGNALVDIELENDKLNNINVKVDVNDKMEINESNFKLNDHVDNSHSANINVDQILTTPAVRRIAKENNINLRDVKPSGKSGRILKEDVLQFIKPLKDESQLDDPNWTVVSLKGHEKHMWKTMTQSLSIPHFVYTDECDVTKLWQLRNEIKLKLSEDGVSLSLMPFFIKAVSKAMEKYPKLNSLLDESTQTLKMFKSHNISLAMDTPDGLTVPNIKNVQSLNIQQIAQQLNRLQEAGQKNSLTVNDLTGGTFSLSNIGVVGGRYAKPVILPPQIVIGAIGKSHKLPRFDEKNNVVPSDVINISWSADHRVVDGITMAKFSNLWKYYVENPVYLLL